MKTTTGRKVRGDAKLEQLNAEQQERLRFWLEENCTYAEIVGLVRDEFGLSVGKSAVCAYYRRHVLSVQQQDEDEIVAELAALPAGDFDAATLRQAKLLLWLAVARPEPDVDQAMKLTAIIDKAERRALAVEELALEKRKVALREKRAEKMKDETSKIGKRAEAEESAGVVGRDEGDEVAAKTQSCEGRSEGAEAENLVCALQNPPRYSGYFEVKDSEKMKEENWEIGKRGVAERADGVEESAGMVGRGESAEVAAKALSCEGRSEVAEEAEITTSKGEGAPLVEENCATLYPFEVEAGAGTQSGPEGRTHLKAA